MKQTAVEWLASQIKTSKYFYKLMEDVNSRSTIAQSDIIEQAKEMEKEQMFGYIKKNYVNGENSLKFHTEEFENYYNETFKSE